MKESSKSSPGPVPETKVTDIIKELVDSSKKSNVDRERETSPTNSIQPTINNILDASNRNKVTERTKNNVTDNVKLNNDLEETSSSNPTCTKDVNNNTRASKPRRNRKTVNRSGQILWEHLDMDPTFATPSQLLITFTQQVNG